MKCKLSDIASVTKLAGFEFTKYFEYIPNGEIIAIRALNLKNGVLVLNDIRRISKTVSKSLERSQLKRKDIVLSYTGTIGECAQITEDNKYHLAPNVCKITPNTELVEPDFLFQYIRSPQFKQLMLNYCHGSTQPTIPMATIRELPIDIPFGIDIQRKIADLLKTLDRKIELNNAINNNLEQQSKALFKSWFVDFEPFSDDGTTPVDWRVGTVGEIIELHDSKRIPLSGAQRAKMEKIYPYYGATSLMDYVDNYLFDGIYLLLGEDGTVIDDKGFPILQYIDGKFWVNNHAHILTGKLGFSVEELYLFFSLTNIKSIVTGAVQQKVSQGNLKSIPTIIPPKEVLKDFDELIQPIFSEIRTLRAENIRLATLRDSLLPRLMSGELDVSDIDL